MISRKLYNLALWYIRKCHSEDKNYRKEVENLECVTYKNCSKAHLIYGLGAEWENFGRYEVIDNAIQRLWEYENKLQEQPKADWIPCEVDMPKEEYETYWIAVEVEQDKPYYYCSAVWTSKDGFRTMDIEANGKVVAWQPIQPYKKEGAENGKI